MISAQAMKSAKWEVASHGYRWIDYQNVDEATEKEHIRKTIAVHEKLFGERPLGMYQGKPNVNTRRLVKDAGFLYDSDAYNDDLPYYDDKHLIIPYTLCNNDMRFVSAQGFNAGTQFFEFLKDAFDVLYDEGGKMMSIGLHCRVVGQPGRFRSLQRFIDYLLSFDDIWICTRADIARHWLKVHPPPTS